MKCTFKIDCLRDVRLVPFSPICEKDTLEIRVQGYNEGEDGYTEVVFKLDGEIIAREFAEVKANSFGFVKCRVPMAGKAGKHTLYVNDTAIPLEVLSEHSPTLDGGFVMIGTPNDRTATDSFRKDIKSLTDSEWKDYVGELAKIGCRCIVFHNCQEYLTLYDQNKKPKAGTLCAHYDSGLYPKSDIAAKDPIGAVLEASDALGINVFISVGNCYFHIPGYDDFDELLEKYGSHKSFYGWYLSNELNLKNFTREGWELLRRQAEIARRISPAKPILVSPFDFPGDEATEYIKSNDFFDIMMPQDCVGQERLNIQQSAQMHQKLKKVCDLAGKHLWANCEAFNFCDGVLVPRFKNGGMYGEEGFIKQIETVLPYVEKVMNFAYTGFFTPSGFAVKIGGDKAVKQYEEYKAYYDEITKKQ